MSNLAARAARNEALKRHREEVAFWKYMSGAMLVCLIAVGYLLLLEKEGDWRDDKAPAGYPYFVIAKGYMDKKGEWRSFDTGEQIEVLKWTPREGL